ncbi:MAG TPA: hypothetical protein P5323_01705 [Candidatus Moranbacteria bacterium]|nr:hypothetical protein [Candidatus Moranbacteria bacterium]
MAIFRATYGFRYREEFTIVCTVADSKSEKDAISLLEEMHPGGFSVLTVRKMQTQTNLLTRMQEAA